MDSRVIVSTVKTRASDYALPLAIVFAASVYGFVNSAAFAIFLMTILLTGVIVVFAILCAQGDGWISAVGAFFFGIVACTVFFGGIDSAVDRLPAKTSTEKSH